jgi:proteic killer suppression protein
LIHASSVVAPYRQNFPTLSAGTSPRFATPLDVLRETSYASRVIKRFRSKETEDLFHYHHSRRFSAIERVALRKLLQLHAATELKVLASPPGNRLEALSGDRKGQHSIRISEQWRICFEWREGHAYEVEITDYH